MRQQRTIYGTPGDNPAFNQMAQNRMFGTPQDQYSEDMFWYPIPILGLTAGSTQRGSVTIQKDADFEWQLSSFFAYVDGDDPITVVDVEVPLVNIEIVDGGSGRNLTDGAVPIPAFFGDGKLPYVLPQPRIFKATSTVQINATSVAQNTDYELYLLLHGVKIFNYNLRRPPGAPSPNGQ